MTVTHSYAYTHPYPPLILRAQTHNLGVRFFLTLPGALTLHTQTSRYQLEIWLMMTDTHTRTHIHA